MPISSVLVLQAPQFPYLNVRNRHSSLDNAAPGYPRWTQRPPPDSSRRPNPTSRQPHRTTIRRLATLAPWLPKSPCADTLPRTPINLAEVSTLQPSGACGCRRRSRTGNIGDSDARAHRTDNAAIADFANRGEVSLEVSKPALPKQGRFYRLRGRVRRGAARWRKSPAWSGLPGSASGRPQSCS